MNIYIVILTTVYPKSKETEILYVGFSYSAANLKIKEFIPYPKTGGGNTTGYIHLHIWRDEEERSIELIRQF